MVSVLDLPSEDVAIALGRTDGGELFYAFAASSSFRTSWRLSTSQPTWSHAISP
jgi:hypothetical protein